MNAFWQSIAVLVVFSVGMTIASLTVKVDGEPAYLAIAGAVIGWGLVAACSVAYYRLRRQAK